MVRSIDVLLIQPPIGSFALYNKPKESLCFNDRKARARITRVPEGLLSIGTILDKLGYKVEILDARLHYYKGKKEFYRILKNKAKHVRICAGISVMTTQIRTALKYTQVIKEQNASLPIVWGGYHPTLYPHSTCLHNNIDFVVIGEGEKPMTELVAALEKGTSYRDIKGLVFKSNSSVKINPQGKPLDVTKLPLPAYHLLEIEEYLEKYPWYTEKKTQGIEYNSTRGCPYMCSFCINSVIPQYRFWRAKNVERVIEEINYLISKFHIKYLIFQEESPFVNRKRALELSRAFIKEKMDIIWYGNIRIDEIIKFGEMLRIIRKSGWSETSVGAESGSDRILGILRKGITAKQTLEAASKLNELDVYCLYSFMWFIPSETHRERLLTLSLMKKLKKIHPRSRFIGPQYYRPYPGSELYNECKRLGLTEPQSLVEWCDFVDVTGEPRSWVAYHSKKPTDRLLHVYEEWLLASLRNPLHSSIWMIKKLRDSFRERFPHVCHEKLETW